MGESMELWNTSNVRIRVMILFKYIKLKKILKLSEKVYLDRNGMIDIYFYI